VRRERFAVRACAKHDVEFDLGIKPRLDGNVAPFVAAVDANPVGRLAHRTALTADDRQAEHLMPVERRIEHRTRARTADA
jgi:hypothetical protein